MTIFRAETPRQKRFGWMIGLLVIFLIMVYRVSLIDSMYMREDEEIAFRTTSQTLQYAIWYQGYQDVHTPTWFALFWGWQQLVGTAETTARFFSLLINMLTLAGVYQLGRRWFGAARFGVFALVVIGVNAYATIYALEIRPYALVLLVAVLSMWLFERWLARQTWRRALAYGASVALLLWVHYFLVFLVLAQVVYALILWGKLSRQALIQGACAAVFALLLWLPWLPTFLYQVQKLREIESASGNDRGTVGIGSTTHATSFDVVARLVEIVSNGQWLLYGAVLIVGMALLWRHARYRLAWSWALLVPAISLTVNLVAAVYTQRYVTYLSVGVALTLGAGLAALPRRVRIWALLGFAALSLYHLPQYLPTHIPHRLIYEGISARAQADDVVYFERAVTTDALVLWQITHYLSSELKQVYTLEEAQKARRVWFVTGHFFDEDVQAAFRALEQTHPIRDVVGDCNREWCYLAQLQEAPPLSEPVAVGDALLFAGVDVDNVTPSEIAVRLWWKVDLSPDKDYSIGVQLLNADGELVAQHDGAIHHYATEIFQTSQLQPDHIYIDHRIIAPDVALPAGEYQLMLVVYQSWDGVRLRFSDGADMFPLRSIMIP